MRKVLIASIAVVTVTLGLSTSIGASTSDHLTKFTFSHPVSLPGVTLAPGTYRFRLADPTVERKVVQVLDESGTRSYAMLQAIPTYRRDTVNDATLTMMHTAKGMPTAVQTFWPMGERAGFEFIYPEAQYAKLTGTVIGGEDRATLSAPTAAPSRTRSAARTTVAIPAPERTGIVPQDAADTPGTTSILLPFVTIMGMLVLVAGALALGRSKM